MAREDHQIAHAEHGPVARKLADRPRDAREDPAAAVVGVAHHRVPRANTSSSPPWKLGDPWNVLPSAREMRGSGVPGSTNSTRSHAKSVSRARSTSCPRPSASWNERVRRSLSRLSTATQVLAAVEVDDEPESRERERERGADDDERARHRPHGSRPIIHPPMSPVHEPLPPNVSFPALEEQVLARWRERDVFRESLRRREGAPRVDFYEGPPTANGRPAPTTCSRASSRTSSRATRR
jgi:hypothetical protein